MASKSSKPTSKPKRSLSELILKATTLISNIRSHISRSFLLYGPEPLPEGPAQHELDLARNIFFVLPQTAPLANRLVVLENNIAEANNTFAAMMEQKDATGCIRAFTQMDKLEGEKCKIKRRLDDIRTGLSERDIKTACETLKQQRAERRKKCKSLASEISAYRNLETGWLDVLETTSWLLRHGCANAFLTDVNNPPKTAEELAQMKETRQNMKWVNENTDQKSRRLNRWVSLSQTQVDTLRPISPKLAGQALEDIAFFLQELDALKKATRPEPPAPPAP